MLTRSPKGIVGIHRGTVVRLACPPVKVELVVVASRNWRHGLHCASQYGPFCRRALALPYLPSTSEEQEVLALEAHLYGVGVTSTRGIENGWLVPPAAFRPKRYSSGQWLFQERVYSEICSQDEESSAVCRASD
jgi:hypothetical protein